MSKLETSRHLYQPPLYSSRNQPGSDHYETILGENKVLNWDLTGLASLLSFGYVCGDRTLFHEISRNPWLSNVESWDMVGYEAIPSHGRQWASPKEIASNLKIHLENEIIKVCQDRKEVYLLLSGGLDSRIIAGILSELVQKGKVTCQPKAVTWGKSDSRDVVFASEVADILGFSWELIDLGPQDLLNNVDFASELGCMVSPVHLHGMAWFKKVSKDALVLNASYGDSVGRAEFSQRHILELQSSKLSNVGGLLKDSFFRAAQNDFTLDKKFLHNRSKDQTPYILYELEMQADYMRGMIAHAMSVINQYCHVYHTFTDPDVYRYMWSLHPAVREDKCYFELLKHLNPHLWEIPWARTNKNLFGITPDKYRQLKNSFHSYNEWINKDLYDDLSSLVDPEWCEHFIFFDGASIRNLRNNVQNNKATRRDFDLFIWLASFRKFVDGIEQKGKKILTPASTFESFQTSRRRINLLRPTIERIQLSKVYRYGIKPIRLSLKKMKSKIDFPPD